MKKAINLGAICLAALAVVTLAFGIAAVATTYSTSNSKTILVKDYYHAKQLLECFAKDGRIKVDDNAIQIFKLTDEELYVEDTGLELIRVFEGHKRELKYYKILVGKAARAYAEDDSEKNLEGLNYAEAKYRVAKNELSAEKKALCNKCVSAFISPYFLIIAVLGVAFVANSKMNYKKEK